MFTFYLQSASMASKEVTIESIYECTGDPNPSDVNLTAAITSSNVCCR